MKKLQLYLILLLFGLSFLSSAQNISNVGGTVGNGESITISGSSFGIGSTIISWDNFDNHATDTDMDCDCMSPIIGPTWTDFKLSPATDPVKIKNDRAHSGNKSVGIEWNSSTINSFGWTGKGPFNSLYITWWGYQDYSGDITTCNRKWYYLYGNSNQYPQGMPLIPGGTTTWGYYNNNSTAQPNYSGTNNLSSNTTYGTGNTAGFDDTKNEWNRWEFYQTLNTDVNCTPGVDCDGKLVYWIDAIKRYERHDYKARFVNGEWRDWRLGNMWQGSNGQAKVWIDDVFISTSPARIEIGNNVSFNSCTHREIQTHTSWSSGQITATVNRGSFGIGETAYLFVVNSNGEASPGYQITFGQDGGTATHTITASTSSGGAITPSGSVSVIPGGNQVFTITADSGYEISDVAVDGVGQGAVSSYTFTNVQANHTISASFAAIGSDIIVDNGGTGTSQSGSWSSSSSFPGYYGSSYMYAPNATGHWYEWSASLTAGTYKVYAWWSAATGRPADAVYDITHSGGTANVTADQTANGGQWNLLGTYTFGATGVVRLNSSANGPEGACADAVKLVEVPTHTITASAGTGGNIAPSGSVQVIQGANQGFAITADSGYEISDVTVDGVGLGAVSSYTFTDVQANHTISASFAVISSDIIVDNEGTGTSQSGSWSSSSYFPGYYGSSYMYAPNATGHWYEWSASLAAGTYEVYAWWSAAAGRPADAVYDITHSGGTANVTADQTANGAQWNLLGTYTFGTTGVVRLNSSANGLEGACADAVKFVEAPTIENLALNKSVTVSGEPEPANPGASAVDGIVTTRWSASGGYPQWLEVDLGDIYNINATEVVCYQDRAYQFTIDAKTTTGGAYGQIVDRSSNTQGGSEASPIRDDFTEVAARYVRINVTGANVYSGTWVSLLEFRVFGVAIPIEGGRVSHKKELLQQIEVDKVSGIEIYPNPSSTSVTIAVNSKWEGLSKVEIYNTQGQKVHQHLDISFPHQVDISSYQEGIYLIKVTNGSSDFVKRIIKE